MTKNYHGKKHFKGKIARILLIVTVALISLTATSGICAYAESEVGETPADVESRNFLTAMFNSVYDSTMKTYCEITKTFSKALKLNSENAKVFALSDEEIEEISEKFSNEAEIYIVKLADGNNTCYVTVDFRSDESLYYRNPFVLRQTTIEIMERMDKLSRRYKGTDYLMDYTHIVGELEVHFLGYRISKKLGGEQGKGVIGSIYHSCSVADLNIDEARFPTTIRLVGEIIG